MASGKVQYPWNGYPYQYLSFHYFEFVVPFTFEALYCVGIEYDEKPANGDGFEINMPNTFPLTIWLK